MIKVIKIGGNIIDNGDRLSHFLQLFAGLIGPKVLVHGGGKLATDLSTTLGIEAKMIDGKRVTDAETLKVVTMVYAGLINKNIVSGLQAKNCNALGLTGADLNLIRTAKRNDAQTDWGFVGDILPDSVNIAALTGLLDAGIAPVFSAITHNGTGNLLNTNADTIASAIAGALAAKGRKVSLVYCFEKKGVLKDINDDTSLIPSVTAKEYPLLVASGVVNKGMIPKLDNAFRSVNEGVTEVRICQAEDLWDFENAGTVITA